MESVYCSFCGKNKEFVDVLVVSKNLKNNTIVGICNECVNICINVVKQQKERMDDEQL